MSGLEDVVAGGNKMGATILPFSVRPLPDGRNPAGTRPDPAAAVSGPALPPDGLSLASLGDGTERTLFQNRPEAGPDNAAPADARLIVAAYILAQDIVIAADTNGNGTLSQRELAAFSPALAMAAGLLDADGDGQVGVAELGKAMLGSQTVF